MPLDTGAAVEAVLALNSQAETHRYAVEQDPDGTPVLLALCQVAGEKWTQGGYRPFSVDYRMEVRLDPGTGIYTFTERETETDPSQNLGGGTTVSHQRGKFVTREHTAGGMMTPRVRGADGEWKQWNFNSGVVKKPLFAALRAQGWRPKRDSWFGRLFER
jgi:hypothetical protein